MTTTVEVGPEAGSFDGDAVSGWLSEMLAALGGLAAGAVGVDDASRVDRIALLQRVMAAASAAQSAEIVAFGRPKSTRRDSSRVTG